MTETTDSPSPSVRITDQAPDALVKGAALASAFGSETAQPLAAGLSLPPTGAATASRDGDPPPATATDFLDVDTESGHALRRMDWAASPLGPVNRWPDALKSSLGLLLSSRSQICLFWGEDLVAFYNDAYSPAIGDNHPRALGRPAREGWAGLWSTLEPLLRDVQRTGRTYNRHAMLFRQTRAGIDEDTFFDVSYNPVRSGDGSIQGVFCIVVDQTRRIVDERRLAILRDLSLRAGIETAADAARGFVSVLADKQQPDVPYALIYLRNRQSGSLHLEATHGGSPDPSVLHVPEGSATSDDPRLRLVARVAATRTVEAVEASFLLDPPAIAGPITVVLPLIAGHDVAGVLVMAKNRHIAIDADARRFSELVAGQLAALLATARVLADERHRAQALEQQVAAALAEREIAEARLRQAQKMEAIGKLTGGVAHDFNNLLQVIGGNLHLLSRDVAGMPRAERRIGNALAGVARGAKLSSQLLAFSRRQPLEPKVVRVERLIAGMDDMFRRSLGEAVEIETRVGAGLWSILVDPTQLENALLNLAINARDAMDGRGRMAIDASNAILDESYCNRHGATPGQYVDVSVTDTGCGMSREIIEQVFEPFFSTKPEGKGTGLGLSMVYGFVHQSGGHIRIDSAPGSGTTLHLFLPRTLEDEPPLLDTDGPTNVAGGNETILVAEDNEGVRETVVAMLVELGYRVLKAKDAGSAMNVLESGVRIDLLFTDVVMPGEMRGPELAARARERIPGLAVLFTSGYTEDALLHGGRLDDGIELLSKPYTAEALAKKLRQVLSARDAGGRTHADHGALSAARRRLRILLVEDDVLIRDTTAELLGGQGHSVAQASNAEAALSLLRRDRFDVLATDLGLPGTSGAALARLAVENDPSLGLVFATGDTEFAAELSGPFAHAVLLAKPYDAPALLQAVRNAVRSSG